MIDDETLLEWLDRVTDQLGQTAVAERAGVSKTMVCDVIYKRRRINDRIAAAIGYKPFRKWEPIDGWDGFEFNPNPHPRPKKAKKLIETEE